MVSLSPRAEKAYLLFGLSFVIAVRLFLFAQDPYPSGDDPAMHAGFVYMLLNSAQLPKINLYHMPGTPFTYPPGFHLLSGAFTMLTGLPIVTALFALGLILSICLAIPLYAFAKNATERVPIGLLAVFLYAVSIPDLYMICWGGFVNVLALFLVYSLLWLAIKKADSDWKYIAAMSVLAGTLFLVHPLSSVVYLGVLFFGYATIAFYYLFKKFERGELLPFLKRTSASGILGGLIASPFVYESAKYYLQATFETSILKETLLRTRMVTPEVLALSFRPALLWVFLTLGIFVIHGLQFKTKLRNVVIFSSALVPLLLTQAYVIGFVVDFQRFLLFSIHPIIILTAAGIWAILQLSHTKLDMRYVSKFPTSIMLTLVFKKIRKAPSARIWHRIWLRTMALGLLVLVVTGMSIFPELVSLNGQYEGYHIAQQPLISSIDWIGRETTPNSVIVADHSFGWWIAGVAHRPTLSATPLQFLSYQREVPLAQAAELITDTSYQIENGILRVREAGPYCGTHTPIFTVIREKVLPDAVFYFNDNCTIVVYRQSGKTMGLSLSEFREKSAYWVSRTPDEGSLILSFGDSGILVTKAISVRKLLHYVSVTYSLTADDSCELISFGLGMKVRMDRNDLVNRAENWVGFYLPAIKTAAVVSFQEPILWSKSKFDPYNDRPYFEILASNKTRFSIHVDVGMNYTGGKQLNWEDQMQAIHSLAKNRGQDLKFSGYAVDTLDYRDMIFKNRVLYIAVYYDIVTSREPEFAKMYLLNPNFELVYQNGEARGTPPRPTWIYVFKVSAATY